MRTRNGYFKSDSNIHIAAVCSGVDARSRHFTNFINGDTAISLPEDVHIFRVYELRNDFKK
jgi:hypothetical protein